MSIFFRKAFKFGPFRLNLSKSGAGVGGGVPGVTAGLNASGLYVAGGSHGMYFRKKIAKHSQSIAHAHGQDVAAGVLMLMLLCGAAIVIIVAFWLWILL